MLLRLVLCLVLALGQPADAATRGEPNLDDLPGSVPTASKPVAHALGRHAATGTGATLAFVVACRGAGAHAEAFFSQAAPRLSRALHCTDCSGRTSVAGFYP